ncbi:MAG: hypothetical protein AAGG80_05870 [Pseudomonadota bacterium]
MKRRSALISSLLAAFVAVVLTAGCYHHGPTDKFGNPTGHHLFGGMKR